MTAKPRILVVDDEPGMLENCRRLLTPEGYDCVTLQDARRVRNVLREARPDLLLLDLRMPAADGMTVLSAALADGPGLPVIVITAHATISSAVLAMREGAFDYLAKPFTADQLLLAVARALRYRGLTLENEALRAQVIGTAGDEIVGSSPEFLNVLEQARKVARTEANVLITGESGTGKEVVARFIHAESPRRSRLFTPVDCAALPEGLLESELFGHERGAFTGAVGRQEGLLTTANGGTAFLDEITEMSPGLQAKLLRALEERKIRRLGSSEFLEIDLRIIAATNMDLDAAMASGAFRHDLFYRLSVVPLRVPPLRARGADVPLLMQSCLRRFAAELGREPPQVSPDVWDALDRYPWPGNVRELRNLALRLVAMDECGRIKLSDLPDNVRGTALPTGNGGGGVVAAPAWLRAGGDGRPVPWDEARDVAIREFQTAYVRSLLAHHDGNVTRAARAAAVSRRTFHRWLAELGSGVRDGLA
jgi:DNA-binding NtrC family response regulator